MKYKITLTLSLITMALFSQEKLLFDELYELQGNKIKVYLDGVYKVIYKDCADYYMICEINDQLEFTDSVYIFDLNDRIVAKGYFKSSRLSGNYTSYYPNGQIESIGKYNNGLRTDKWKFFFKNGQLKKIIDFGKGENSPSLLEFYKINGKQKVIAGNGKFQENLQSSISSSRKINYKGKVQNGLFDGTWKIVDNGQVVAKEVFDNGKLIEATSFSLMLGNQKYYDNPSSKVYGINYLENIKIWGPSVCMNGQQIETLGLSKSFYNSLYQLLVKHEKDFNKSWYFLDVQADDNGIFLNAVEFPKNELLNNLINNGLKDKELETIWSQPRTGNQVIIIYFNNDVYFSNTDRINNFILNFRY